LALVGGGVYYTYMWGVWDTSTQRGQRLLDYVRHTVVPGTFIYTQQVCVCVHGPVVATACAQMPTPSSVRAELATSWNNGVQCTFSALNNAPAAAVDALTQQTQADSHLP
jgi:hypothetical protein